jgi:hypothetical protein
MISLSISRLTHILRKDDEAAYARADELSALAQKKSAMRDRAVADRGDRRYSHPRLSCSVGVSKKWSIDASITR